MRTKPDARTRRDLSRFLQGAFRSSELRIFLHDLPLGGQVRDSIAWEDSLAHVAYEVVEYQVLEFDRTTLTVHTRRREEPAGAWKPDARWTSRQGGDPLPRYIIEL